VNENNFSTIMNNKKRTGSHVQMEYVDVTDPLGFDLFDDFTIVELYKEKEEKDLYSLFKSKNKQEDDEDSYMSDEDSLALSL
jgi:hypothetical protein